MADGTKIEWSDATVNIVNGCSVVSPGCTNCYAMRLAGTRMKHHPSRQGLTVPSKAGPVWNGQVRFVESELLKPLRWRRARKIFLCAHGDLFHENVPDEWIDRVFAMMALCGQHTFQVLTKRAARMREYCTGMMTPTRLVQAALALPRGDVFSATWPLPNVWLGVSAEDQQRADERIPLLLDTPAAVRFVSAEPLLGPIDLYNGDPDPRLNGHRATKTFLGEWWEPGDSPKEPPRRGVDWVIAGGESGPSARPCHPDWARSLRDQCAAAGVPSAP